CPQRLAFVAADLPAGVTRALALVRLRRVIAANVRRNLADKFLVRALKHDRGLIGDGDFNVLWNRTQDRVRKTETKIEIRSLHCRFKTDALDLKLFRETFAHADDHVVHERTG